MFSLSIVPTGLVLNLMHDPGTKVPGYFPGVPTGRKMPKLKIHHCIRGTGYLASFPLSESRIRATGHGSYSLVVKLPAHKFNSAWRYFGTKTSLS